MSVHAPQQCRRHDLCHLRSLQDSLRHVHIAGGNPQLTDAAARHLGSLRSLRDLDLSGIQLTDAGLCSLSQLVFLKRLQITNCPKLTEQVS